MKLVTERCTLHRGREAGWRCRVCLRRLCPGCVVEVEVHPTAYVKCNSCQGAVEVLTRPGSDIPFARALRGALFLPVGLGGVFLVFALALVGAELNGLSTPARESALLVWSVVAWGVGIAIAHASAEGAATLRDLRVKVWPELLRPALVAAALTAPALLLPTTGLGAGCLLVAAAFVLVPVLLNVLSQGSLLSELSPLRAAQTLGRLDSDGLLAALCTAALWLFAWRMGALSEAPPTEIPPLWSKTAGALGALSLFLVPRVLGLLVQARGEDLDYAFRRRGVVPLLPGARAELSETYRAPEPPPRPRPEPIELEESAGKLVLEPLSSSEKTKK